MKAIQKVKVGNKTYSYERQRLNAPSLTNFADIEPVAKIWASVIPNWGVPGKRVRCGISLEKCFLAKTCPETLTEEQFEIFATCPIDHRLFFKYRKKAKKNANLVSVRESMYKAIKEYIQKYQHLLPAEAEPAPENISN